MIHHFFLENVLRKYLILLNLSERHHHNVNISSAQVFIYEYFQRKLNEKSRFVLGAIQEENIKEFFPGAYRVVFQPRHERNLMNPFACFVDYETKTLNSE